MSSKVDEALEEVRARGLSVPETAALVSYLLNGIARHQPSSSAAGAEAAALAFLEVAGTAANRARGEFERLADLAARGGGPQKARPGYRGG